MLEKKLNNIESGWNFDNSYRKLPNILYTKIKPIPVKNSNLVYFNKDLAEKLGLNFTNLSKKYLSDMFSGNILPENSEPIAQAYAGHQFGHFTMLGDGRGILLGEHISPNNKKVDVALKGSGKTPYSRNGDGRASLGPMLREYIISEAMYGLKIPTTRSLAVTTTGEIINRETPLEGSILTRIASSHIRVGTFQYLSMKGDIETLKKLVKYSLERHYPEETIIRNPAITLLESVISKQISLVINWMRVGFIHGVLNTDNVTISGETIDYGPCAFMNIYNPLTVFSSIDHQGRYSFNNQSIITHWNISRFAETLIPLIDSDEKKAIKIGEEIINQFQNNFKIQWVNMMRDKLGFFNHENEDEIFIQKLLEWMYKNKADYTNTFLYLINNKLIQGDMYNLDSFKEIKNQWEKRILKNNLSLDLSKRKMNSNNPFVIPRNHMVEKSLNNILENKDYKLFKNILKICKNPYIKNKNNNVLNNLPDPIDENKYKTFCGT